MMRLLKESTGTLYAYNFDRVFSCLEHIYHSFECVSWSEHLFQSPAGRM